MLKRAGGKVVGLFRELDARWRSASVARTKLGKYIILAASLVHVGWAILLSVDPRTMAATPVNILGQVMGGPLRASVVLTLAAITAMVFPFLTRDIKNSSLALLLIPQQALLIMSAGAGVAAAYSAHYADGVMRPQAFILADQFPVIVMALLYTAAVLESAFSKGDRGHS